jgi:hypothetical protein
MRMVGAKLQQDLRLARGGEGKRNGSLKQTTHGWKARGLIERMMELSC